MKKLILILLLIPSWSHAQKFLTQARFLGGKNFMTDSASLTIFKKLENRLFKSKHIIFICNDINHLPTSGTKDFDALVYDYKNKQTYFFRNENRRIFDINEVIYSNNKRLKLINTILIYYLNDKLNYLKSVQNSDLSDGGYWHTYIKDIDLVKKTIKVNALESIMLNNKGEPDTFDNVMKDN